MTPIKHCSSESRFLRSAGALLALTCTSLAQSGAATAAVQSAVSSSSSSATASAGNSGTLIAPVAGEHRKTFDSAKTLVQANNLTAVEQVLTAKNKFQSGTANWHMETTHALVQLADEVAREGKGSSAASLANLAIQHLATVDNTAKDTGTRARAKAMSGFIQERYLGDPTAALASYRAALQLAPNDKATQEALERLENADANLRAKIKTDKK